MPPSEVILSEQTVREISAMALNRNSREPWSRNRLFVRRDGLLNLDTRLGNERSEEIGGRIRIRSRIES